MLYVLICEDHPGKEDLRQKTRSAHLDFIAEAGARVKIAGPLVSDDGVRSVGSMLVIEAANRAEAESFAALDPYARAGLFAKTDIRPWKWLINNPEDR